MYKYSFRVPPYYTLLVRSLSVLEGIALSSEPGYKVLRAAYPWVARRLLTDRSPELRETLLALLYKDGRFQFSRCESLLREAIKSPARRSAGAASGRDGRAPPDGVVRSDALALLLSPEGADIRDIVVEELSKGLDAAWRVTADRAVGAASENLAGLLQMREQLPLRGAVTEQVLLGVQRVPTLSDQGDIEQIEGLLRLARLLGTTAGMCHGGRTWLAIHTPHVLYTLFPPEQGWMKMWQRPPLERCSRSRRCSSGSRTNRSRSHSNNATRHWRCH